MFDGYPLPAHVAAIWMADGRIWVAFPPSVGHTRGHKIWAPDNVEGFAFLVKMLKEREIAKSFCIGTKASPHQAQLKITEIIKVTKSPEVIELEKKERAEASRLRQRTKGGTPKGSIFDDISLEDLGL